MIISGVPVTEDEVQNIVVDIAEKLGTPLKAFHIVAAYRLPAYNNKIPANVQFNNIDIKALLICESKKVKIHSGSLGFRI